MNRSARCARIGLIVLLGMLEAGNAVALEKLQPAARAEAEQEIEFNVYLPLHHTFELNRLLTSQHTLGSPDYHKWLSPTQFRDRFGPTPTEVARITAALAPFGLTVTGTHSHGVSVRGKVGAAENAFAVSIWRAAGSKHARCLLAQGRLNLPPTLSQMGAQVLHFSPTIRQHKHSKRVAIPDNRYGEVGPYWFTDLKQAYEFPSYQALSGKGVKIGILMSNDFLDSDMQMYFAHEKLAVPQIVRVPVFGGAPFDANDAAEVSLDIQQAGGMAPGATIYDYNIPDLSDSSILAAYVQIVEDNLVDVVNSSFGGAEGFYTADYNDGVDMTGLLRVYDDIFKQGNAQGITFVASSGDSGGLGLPSPSYVQQPQSTPVVTAQFLPGIDTPASSPNVTAVGGTNLITTDSSMAGTLESKYVSENAYGDPEIPYDPYGVGNLVSGGYWGSGGGESIVFPKPLYQRFVRTGSQARTIPDLSLQMGGCPGGIMADECPPDRSFVVTIVNGMPVGIIGTSASAPEFAGLLALEIEHLGGRLGNVNYQVYALAAAQALHILPFNVFHDDIPGFNGYYSTRPGYDMVVGNGTVYGRNFIMAPNVPVAADPQTPSNP